VISKYSWDSDTFVFTIYFRNKSAIQFFNFPLEVAEQFAHSLLKVIFIKRLMKNPTYPYNKVAKLTSD
jgi:hypothetical protein